jgi:hypothetical protein
MSPDFNKLSLVRSPSSPQIASASEHLLASNASVALPSTSTVNIESESRPLIRQAFSHQPYKAHPGPSWHFLTFDFSRVKVPGHGLRVWVKLIFLNLLLTISEQHRTGPWGYVCENWRPSPLRPGGGFWIYPWSERHVVRQCAPGSKSAVRIHFGHCRRFHRWLADGSRNYLDLLLRTPDIVPAAFVNHPGRTYSVDHSA